MISLGTRDGRVPIRNSLKRAHDVPGFRKMVSKRTKIDDCQTAYFGKFFPSGALPVGLRKNQKEIVLICQQKSRRKFKQHKETYYTTLFDQIRGIPVYSAYKLTSENTKYELRRRPTWQKNEGILKNK